MDGAVPAQGPAQFLGLKQVHRRQARGQRLDFIPAVGGAVPGLKNDPALAFPEPSLGLFESGHRFAGPPGKAQQIQATTHHQAFQLLGQIGGNLDPVAGGPRKKTLGAGCIYHIALCTQP